MVAYHTKKANEEDIPSEELISKKYAKKKE